MCAAKIMNSFEKNKLSQSFKVFLRILLLFDEKLRIFVA